MTDPRGYYAQLGVASTATAAEIKRAFYERAKELHPDAGDLRESAAFQALGEAYEVLGNGRHRADYDHLGEWGRWEGQTLEWIPRGDHQQPSRQPRSSRRMVLAGLALLITFAFFGVAYLESATRDVPPANRNYQSSEPSGPPALSPADAEADAAAAESLAIPAAPKQTISHRPIR